MAERLRPGASVHFESCVLRDLLNHSRFAFGESDNLTAAGSSLSFFDRGEMHDVKPPARDLNDLFPDWRSRAR